MQPTLRRRLAIIALASLGLVLDGYWMLSHPAGAGGKARLEVPQAVVDKRFAEFGDGPQVDHTGTEGDFARAGYIWAIFHRPIVAYSCPKKVPAFKRGCVAWLSDMIRLDENWGGDQAVKKPIQIFPD